MATKDKLLSLLLENQGSYLSGEELAGTLGVSRTAVWKAVKSLQEAGCPIEAVTNRGYCLSHQADLPDMGKISTLLRSPLWKLQYLPKVDSTNDALKAQAEQGAPEGTVLLAGCQTRGRGRMGRTFYSPQGTGLYLSLLLRPRDLAPDQALQITTMAAAAMTQAIREVTGLKVGIKWVNDLLLEGRKLCGILTEASLNLEAGVLSYAVLGLGLNLCPPKGGFPQELVPIAGTLLQSPRADLKNQLTAAFLNAFGQLYETRDFTRAAQIYRSASILIGKQVLAGDRRARVLDINDRCQLVLRWDSGEVGTLSYGEVQIVNL